MVEVFKTDVRNNDQAAGVLHLLHDQFHRYQANFDLEDCDRILRIKCEGELIQVSAVLVLLNQCGVNAEVLKEEAEF